MSKGASCNITTARTLGSQICVLHAEEPVSSVVTMGSPDFWENQLNYSLCVSSLFNIIHRDPIPPTTTTTTEIPRNGVQKGLMPRNNNHLNECIHVQIQILCVMGVFQRRNLWCVSFKFQSHPQQSCQS